MTVNKEMFRKIDAVLTEFPELHDQRFWEAEPETTGSCGTTRCVAGWAVWIRAQELDLISRKRDSVEWDMLNSLASHYGITLGGYHSDAYERLGTEILGLTARQAESLFQDFLEERVVERVASFARTGKDIPEFRIAPEDA